MVFGYADIGGDVRSGKLRVVHQVNILPDDALPPVQVGIHKGVRRAGPVKLLSCSTGVVERFIWVDHVRVAQQGQ